MRKQIMTLTDEQLLNIINNKILSYTLEEKKTIDDFTGGYVQRLLKSSKVVLFFGYKRTSKHPVSIFFEIEDNVTDIWFNAIGVKLCTIKESSKSSNIEELIVLSKNSGELERELEREKNKKENRIEGSSVPPRGSTGVSHKSFKKPSIKEIQEFIESKHYQIDAEQFYHFYESKGWMIGKNKMKSWYSALATWSKKKDFTPKKTLAQKNREAIERYTKEYQQDNYIEGEVI